MSYEVEQKLKKVWDGRIVTIKKVNHHSIVLDGDFEPNHTVMKNKVNDYYKVLPKENLHE